MLSESDAKLLQQLKIIKKKAMAISPDGNSTAVKLKSGKSAPLVFKTTEGKDLSDKEMLKAFKAHLNVPEEKSKGGFGKIFKALFGGETAAKVAGKAIRQGQNRGTIFKK